MNLFLPYAPARPFSLMMRQTRRRLTVTPDLPGDALILRDPFRPLLAACAAAAAVAAHECGHAVQHARGYAPLTLRSQLVPIVQFSSRMAMFVIIIGLVILASTQNELLCWIGVGMIGVSALFSIITLPVEYNASQRALAWLQSSHTLEGAQLGQAKEALSWAARTYLVAALSAVASLLYYVLMILGRRD